MYMGICFGVNKSENSLFLFQTLLGYPNSKMRSSMSFNRKLPMTSSHGQWHLRNHWEPPSVSNVILRRVNFLNINPHLHSYPEYEILSQVIFLSNKAYKKILWLCQYLEIRALSSCLDMFLSSVEWRSWKTGTAIWQGERSVGSRWLEMLNTSLPGSMSSAQCRRKPHLPSYPALGPKLTGAITSVMDFHQSVIHPRVFYSRDYVLIKRTDSWVHDSDVIPCVWCS